jgi:hypothetical protein
MRTGAAAHLAEVLVWSLIYMATGAAPEGADLIYFAFVNHTTPGYGDVTPVQRWHLVGPMTAMNGVLLFGWSTAVMFEVLRITLMAGGGEAAIIGKTLAVRVALAGNGMTIDSTDGFIAAVHVWIGS